MRLWSSSSGWPPGLSSMVGHGQNTASGQRFGEPPVRVTRDASTNLATKVLAPFTVASVGDVMVKRSGAVLAGAEFQNVFNLLREANVTFGNMEGNLADVEHFDGPLRGMMGDKDVGAESEGTRVRPDEPRQQPHLRLGRRGHVFDDGAARCRGHRPRRHRQESRGRARAGVFRHAEGPRRARRDARAAQRQRQRERRHLSHR